VTLASLAQVVDNVERQCNSIAQQMHRLDRKIDNTENSL
jgi:hypothetical protein